MQRRSQGPEKRKIQTREDGGREKRRPDPLETEAGRRSEQKKQEVKRRCHWQGGSGIRRTGLLGGQGRRQSGEVEGRVVSEEVSR